MKMKLNLKQSPNLKHLDLKKNKCSKKQKSINSQSLNLKTKQKIPKVH